MMPPDRSVYFDDFARKQESPKKDLMTSNVNQRSMNNPPSNIAMTRPGNSLAAGACEWDRLMKEREDLLQTGVYTQDDPLIKEIER